LIRRKGKNNFIDNKTARLNGKNNFIDNIMAVWYAYPRDTERGIEMPKSTDFINKYLETYFDEVTAKEFYRDIFPRNELASHKEIDMKYKYNGIAVELLPKEENGINARRYILTDELDYIDKLEKKNNFIIISPISYIGKSRKADNARYIYAIAIDLDGIESEQNIIDLFYQVKNEVIPRPTYVVSSGSGLHLYYCFKKAIPCYKNIVKQLQALKQDLTKKIWNKYITTLYEKPQQQSLFQGFRMVGGVTKDGNRVRSFLTGKKIDIEYLNDFCMYEKSKVKDITYKSNLSIQEAAAKYPEWYNKRIINKQPKGVWQCKRDLYNWWFERLKEEISVGHRYYGIMCLAIYAKKSGVSRSKLEKDAFSLLDKMEAMTTNEDNHFTREDILAALELYNDSYITFPIDTIVQLTALPIEKNKRNGRKQADHIKLMNYIRDEINNNKEWQNKEGRPKGSGTKENQVREWQQQHPNGRKADCIKETGISKPTVYKYWR